MMIPSYQKLLEPYGITLDVTIKWLKEQSGAPMEVIDSVIRDIMLKLAQGITWSTEGCSCGCELTNPNTAIEHYMLREVKKLYSEALRSYSEVIERTQWNQIIAHIELENKKYLKENMKPGLWQRIKAILFMPIIKKGEE